MNCPVQFSVKKLMIFLNIKIPKDTQHRRSDAANKLKEVLRTPNIPNRVLEGKLVYVLKFPSNSQHKYHLEGEEAALLLKTLDPKVEEFIRAEVRNGCLCNKDLESKTKLFVERNLLQDVAKNRAFHEYFPSRQKIRNIKYSERRKMGLNTKTVLENPSGV